MALQTEGSACLHKQATALALQLRCKGTTRQGTAYTHAHICTTRTHTHAHLLCAPALCTRECLQHRRWHPAALTSTSCGRHGWRGVGGGEVRRATLPPGRPRRRVQCSMMWRSESQFPCLKLPETDRPSILRFRTQAASRHPVGRPAKQDKPPATNELRVASSDKRQADDCKRVRNQMGGAQLANLGWLGLIQTRTDGVLLRRWSSGGGSYSITAPACRPSAAASPPSHEIISWRR